MMVPAGLLAAALSAGGPAPASSAARFSFEDVFRLRRAEDVQISPDGRTVAYTRAETDIRVDGRRRSLWVVDRASGRERRLVEGAENPRWSPDGARLAFSAQAADGSPELRVIGGDGAGERIVAKLTSPASPAAWAPSGDALAFSSFVPEPRPAFRSPVDRPAGARWAAPPVVITSAVYQSDGERFGTPGAVRLFVVPVSGGTPRQVTDGPTSVDGDPIWTADGRSLLFTGSRAEAVGRTYGSDRVLQVAADGAGEATPVSPPGLGAHAPTLSRDGKFLAFVASRPNAHDYQPSSLFLMRLGDREARELTAELDREVERPRFSADGASLFLTYGDRGHEVLARQPLTGRRTVVVQDLGDDGAFSLAADGTVAFATASPTRPADAAVLTPSGATVRLTALNEGLLGAKALGRLRAFSFRSPLDGVEVRATALLPPGAAENRPPPLILSIHGGPHGFDDPSWDTEDQLFAAAGYAVLRVDYRGSLSYGFAFADRIARDFPGPAYEDLMGGVDAAVKAGIGDPERLFVTGGSAGGELAAWTVGRTRRFRAAVAVKPVIDAVSASLTTSQFEAARSAFGAWPWEAPQLLWSRSPLSAVGQVATPTLLMVGELDRNTPPTEAEQFYDALKLRGVPTELVIVPDAGHDSIAGTPSRQVAGAAIALDWFGRYGGPAPPDSARPGSVGEAGGPRR